MFTFLCDTISITPAKNPDNDKVPQNEVLIFDLQKWTNFNLVQKSQSSKVIPILQKIRENVVLSKSNCNFGFFLKDFGSIVHQQQPPLVSRSKSNSTMSGAKKKCTSSTTFIQTIAVCNNESLKIPTCNNGKSSA